MRENIGKMGKVLTARNKRLIGLTGLIVDYFENFQGKSYEMKFGFTKFTYHVDCENVEVIENGKVNL